MHDPEPSDASQYKAVNRIALFTEYGLFEAVSIPPPKCGLVGAAGQVINLDEPEGTTDLVPALTRTTREEFDIISMTRASIYFAIYDAVRQEIGAGKSSEEVRATFLQSAAAFQLEYPTDVEKACAEAILEAVQDALADRPMRYKPLYGA